MGTAQPNFAAAAAHRLTPPTMPVHIERSRKAGRVLAICFMLSAAGVALSHTSAVSSARLKATVDPNWALQAWQFYVIYFTVFTSVIAIALSPLIALVIWRKNLVIAIPLFFLPSCAAMWYMGPAGMLMAILLFGGGLVAVRFVLPDRIRRFIPGTCQACG